MRSKVSRNFVLLAPPSCGEVSANKSANAGALIFIVTLFGSVLIIEYHPSFVQRFLKSPSIFEQVAKEFYGSDAFLNLPGRGVFDGSCQGCVPLALHLASLATSFEDAVRLAVSYGGDSDTMGAIVGSLAEAQYEIPPEMTSRAKSYLPKDMLGVVEQFEKNKK